MRTRVVTTKIVIVSVMAIVVAFISLNAGGGSLDPTEPPGPTMRTLDEIYNVVAPPTPVASVRGYLKIDDIPGESADDEHKEWIEVLSYGHGISRPVDLAGGGSTDRSAHQDVSIIKRVDKSTPLLSLHVCNGTHIGDVTLDLVRVDSGGKHIPYMKYTLTNVIVTSYGAVGGSGGEAPAEDFSLNYEKITWTYTTTDEQGTPTGTVENHWDVVNDRGL